MAIIQRQNALDKYYENPNICLACKKIIEVGNGQKVSEVRKKKFCNHSCAMAYNIKNNKTYRKNYELSRLSQNAVGECKMCKKSIEFKRSKNGSYNKRSYCDRCRLEVQAKNNGAETHISNLTREQVMKRYAKYYIGRNMIRKHAVKVYFRSNMDKKCLVCGYHKYIDVCHKKDVSEFSGDALISEINHINNLVALCPTHHIEFDNELMDENDLKKIMSP